MIALKVLLVPTDFDPCAEAALAYAVEIARPVEARIVLLYACPLNYSAPWSGAMPPDGSVIEALLSAGRDALAKIITTHKDCGVHIDAVTKLGDVRTCILEAAKETHADMIVMGSHGRGGFSRMLLGSTADGIVHNSEVPVLIVRGPREKDQEVRST